MSFNAETFAAELRRTLAGEPISTALVVPTAASARPPLEVVLPNEPLAVDIKDAPLHAWRMVPVRDPSGFIVSITCTPIERVEL